jgi:hypothetical protein
MSLIKNYELRVRYYNNNFIDIINNRLKNS